VKLQKSAVQCLKSGYLLQSRYTQALTSKSQDKWVWIGLRGVYALKEWGFKRPDKGLYQTVFEIIMTNIIGI